MLNFAITEFYEFPVRGGAHSTLLLRTFLYLKAVGRAYVRICDVASTNLYEPNKEATRWCTEGKRGTGASKKKPADSSRERIGTVGRRLSHVATTLGREIYWSSSLRRSSLATNV
jgi:hypothetical protein